MENDPQDRFVKETLRRLYGQREEGLDEFKIGSHKKGGCSICYEGGQQAIENYKGGVKIYKKADPNDAIHIDIDSHNNNKGKVVGSGRKKGGMKVEYNSSSDSDSDSSSDSEMKGGSEPYARKIGGRKLTPKSDLPSSSMAGGASKMQRRQAKVKEIMKKRGVKMIEASKIIKAENIKY